MQDNMHRLSVLVLNRPGVLTRISGLFARRGYNIDSLTVCATENDDYSRMTVTVRGNDKIIKQIQAQLQKQVDVVQIADLDRDDCVFRELLFNQNQMRGKSAQRNRGYLHNFQGEAHRRFVRRHDDYRTYRRNKQNRRPYRRAETLRRTGNGALRRLGTRTRRKNVENE